MADFTDKFFNDSMKVNTWAAAEEEMRQREILADALEKATKDATTALEMHDVIKKAKNLGQLEVQL